MESDPDRFLNAPKKVAFVAYPLELLTYATINAPQISFEVWIDLDAGFALNVQPRGIWYPPTDDRASHGGGVGGAVGAYWFSRRSLSGPFFGIYGGDIEAFFDEGRGRIYGGNFVFGYAVGFDSGGILSFSLGLGYWHRAGILDTGVQWPEVLALRIGTGYGWGTGTWNQPRDP